MFYSQFILAKKGPLGTIWIAAHLERKLRKNQVADTDIGISVDSILFPDVPIALRLSSHLLLGVVRIYSRKVNYLFHDCSEALLKIKQAFRSTAVDLPPEESTAPYHSITLPETFDLDDFELPDSAFLQGSFVDHHVSTREQITLQDTMDGTGYSTSQFGLEERFGDGDASQIRLDLDEDLFMDKNPSPQPASVPLGSEEGDVHHGESSILLTSMDIDDDQNGCNEYKNLETPKDLSELLSNDCEKNVLSSMEYLKRNYDSSRQHGYNIQTPDLNEVFFPDDHIDDPSAVSNHTHPAAAAAEAPAPDLSECAQAPSTPGLMEEAIPANFQEIPVLSPQEKVSSSNDVEVINPDTFITPHLELEAPNAAVRIDLMHGVTMCPELTDNAQAVTFLTPASKPETVGLVQQCSDGFLAASSENHLEHGQKSEDNLHNGFSSEVNDNGVPRNLVLADNAQIVPSPSPALTESKPGSLVQCSYGSLAESGEAHPEHGQKSEDNLRNDFISEVNNLPSVHDNVEGILPEISCLDGLVIPSCPHEASNLESHVNKSTTDTVVVVNSDDNVLVPRVISEINSSSHENKSEPSILGNQNHLEDEGSCLTSNRSAHSSDLYLRSCNSRSNQTNMSSSKDGVLVENAPESSHRELGCISETPLREEALHVSGSYAEVQGEHNCTTDSTYTMQKVQQKSEYVLSELKSCFTDLTDPDELSTGLISKDTRLDHLNYSASSEYTEPEKMLLAPSGDVDLPTGLGQFTADKRITESAGSVDRVSSLIGKKHRLIDSTPVLQNGSSTKMLGLPRLRRNTAYIPDDDDLLASILVGRTPGLRTGSTPQPSKTASRKRPRLTHKIGVPKRKVLLDDTMILQADAMRQQLINTEDIRRMRKKAPCTRPEIWIIQKSTMEEEIFSESVFSGISAELNSLHARRYGMDENPGSQIDADKRHSYDELSKEIEHYRNSDYVLDNSGKEMEKPIAFMSDKVNTGIQGSSGTSVSIEAPSCQDCVEFNAQEKLEPCPPQLELLNNNQTITVSTIESNLDENAGFEMPLLSAPHSGSEHEISTICRVEESSIKKNNKDDSSLEKVDRVCIHQEQESVHELIQPSEKLAEVNDGTLNVAGSASVEDVASAEDATRFRIADSMTLAEVNDDVLVRAEDTYISKDESILEGGNIIDVVSVSCPQYCHSDVGMIENGVPSISMLDSHLPEDRAGLPADSSIVFGHANYLIPDTAIENGEENNGVRLVSMLDSILLEDGAGLPADSSTVIGHANSPIPDMAIESSEPTDLATMTSNQAMDEMKEGSLEVTLGGEPVRERVLTDEERFNSEIISSEDPQVASSYPLQSFMETEHIPSAVGENSGMQECNLEGGLDVESAPMDFAMARESSDFCSGIDGNDTEFLNVDDEADFDEEDHNDVPNPEEAQSLENSGWSSRTRGVAKYLKGLFDEESGRGRKNVAVDHLLAGKTRKEASRMFFETLVLKTRDYIHVEQEDPFDSINIKPRMKLLKSEF